MFWGCSATLGITTVPIEILGAEFQILGLRCAHHHILLEGDRRATTNVQNGLVFSFWSLLFSFRLFELKQ